MTDDQLSLTEGAAFTAEERELFGDRAVTVRPELDSEGDWLHGLVVSVEHDVDLKTGYAPATIVTLEGISGLLASRTKRVERGQLYAWAVLHATAKNQLEALDPEPAKGERMAIRRGRQFTSTVEGPSFGKELTSWDIKMPDRAF